MKNTDFSPLGMQCLSVNSKLLTDSSADEVTLIKRFIDKNI